ncbi:membrane protein [Microbacterium phage Burro]|uniref:Membrane protein n=1 Tax=Microbacterium phage Burro TaxID=2315703 RepID=A0A386KLE6_9CAUD|nr:membrane protein [Microbacterium phage Burro]AYD86180.1 membrane protein [Microbacterium phage Burro]
MTYLDPAVPEDDDLTTKNGFIKRSRKALVAGLTTAIGAFGPAFAVATGDGVITGEEVALISVTAFGLGVAAFAAVWKVPNAD